MRVHNIFLYYTRALHSWILLYLLHSCTYIYIPCIDISIEDRKKKNIIHHSTVGVLWRHFYFHGFPHRQKKERSLLNRLVYRFYSKHSEIVHKRKQYELEFLVETNVNETFLILPNNFSFFYNFLDFVFECDLDFYREKWFKYTYTAFTIND